MTIRAVSDFKGYFKQGDVGILRLKITDFNSIPKDPESITISISSSSDVSGDTIIDNAVPVQADTGDYIYEWHIDSSQETGKYNVVWTYTVDGIEQTENQYVVVTTMAPSDYIEYSERMIAWRALLDNYIGCAQSIPVYNEQAKPSRDNKTFYFTFNKWNQCSGVKIYRNNVIMNDDVEVDYFNGKVVFDNTLLPQDIITADYNFRWFSDQDLNDFLNTAVQTVNIYPPASGYTLGNVSAMFIPIVLYGAAKDALRKLMMCLQFQQPQQVFGGPEKAQNVFSNLETLKKNYEGDWKALLEQKKYGKYPRMQQIVVPEFTMPGSRSRWFNMMWK